MHAYEKIHNVMFNFNLGIKWVQIYLSDMHQTMSQYYLKIILYKFGVAMPLARELKCNGLVTSMVPKIDSLCWIPRVAIGFFLLFFFFFNA